VPKYRRIEKFPEELELQRNTKSIILSFNPNSEVFCSNGKWKIGSQEFIDVPLS